MSQREPSGSNWSAILFWVCLTCSVTIALLALWPDGESPPEHSVVTTTASDPSRPGSAAAGIPTAGTNPIATDRQLAKPAEPTGTPPLIFEECVAKLCTMGLRTAELAQEDEIDAAKELDAQVRALLEQLLTAFDDAGERSLGLLIEMAGAPAKTERPPLENTRLGVLQIILRTELTRREDAAEKLHNRSRIDPLVQALLDAMPIGEVTAKMGDRCLNKAPHLRLAHEASVLHLLEQASQGQFPRSIATNMLLTLWQNLQASGERSSEELSQLALLKLDGQDPSLVVAACRQLLADEKLRPLVLAWLRERKDHGLAAQVAEIAAAELPVQDALTVLRELSPMLQHTRGTFMGLGARAPELLADAYREHLAANNHPDIRRELVMGVGMLPNPDGLKIAKLALVNDPSPEVRIQAMYVHTVHALPGSAEDAVTQLLDDPVIAASPTHLAGIVLALQNLEHRDPNILARLGARLGSMGLTENSRNQLNEILERTLPGGKKSHKYTGVPQLGR